jgi:hypothetical protein
MMLTLGSLAFLNPWLLAALAALPVLWVLLRAIPPSPRRLGFPGVGLLLGLEDPERTPVRTPWWLLLLRCLIAAAAIAAFAQPVLNPRAQLSESGPLLLLMDGGWASADDWEARRTRALDALDQAARAGRPVTFHVLAQPLPPEEDLESRPAADWRGEVEALRPSPWAPRRARFEERLRAAVPMVTETLWLTDGLAHEEETLAETLAGIGPLAIVGPGGLPLALRPPRLADGALTGTVLRAEAGVQRSVSITAMGRTEQGGLRPLGRAQAVFGPDDLSAEAAFDLPLELRNRVDRLMLDGADSAAAVALSDDSVRRRRAGLVSGGSESVDQQLVSDLHYLRTALEGRAEMVEGDLVDVLDSNPDVMFLADVGRFTEAEATALGAWVESGGLLVRFAGPRLARGADALAGRAPAGGLVDDPLLPVTLRAGGRAVGGAMAWTQPQSVRPFPGASPFAGLDVSDEVEVSRQILAQLGPDLPQRTWAALADGTPLVTADDRGAGRVVLFHVTANAEWSSLPLSGLFVEMVSRLLQIAGGTGGLTDDAALEGVSARPLMVLDGFGRLSDAVSVTAVPATRLREAPGPDARPGVYAAGDSVLAFNVMQADSTLAAAPPPPLGTVRERLGMTEETPLAPWLLALALLLFALDTLVTLSVSGRLPGLRRRARSAAAALLALGLALPPVDASAQDAPETVDDEVALQATLDTVLAYVLTGDEAVDRLSAAGLRGLGRELSERTAIEPGPPVGVDLETDVIAFYSLLYWPITPRQPTPSDEAIARLNSFMRTGGMIVFDTRDRHLDIGIGSTANSEALQRIAGRLDLPPLEPVPNEHVLTRTFFLLDTFPGRYAGGRVWVEANATDGGSLEDMAARNANDGVSPVIVGDADWAAAWAEDETGEPLVPIGGGDGWRQREMAYRFGINAVMYAMTGNYKSDQVHVPALLERLGQ